jgi:hypothetical protein
MARQKQIIETITCDSCGRQVKDAITATLGWGRDQWELDLCTVDADKLSAQFDKWVENGRKVRANRGRRASGPANADWDYLESLGFTRHRGRKTAEEVAALAKRR